MFSLHFFGCSPSPQLSYGLHGLPSTQNLWLSILSLPQMTSKALHLRGGAFPVVSIIYIFLSFVIGEEAKDVLNWIRELPYRLEMSRFGPLTVLPAQYVITTFNHKHY
jgi:hypothetical protein